MVDIKKWLYDSGSEHTALTPKLAIQTAVKVSVSFLWLMDRQFSAACIYDRGVVVIENQTSKH